MHRIDLTALETITDRTDERFRIFHRRVVADIRALRDYLFAAEAEIGDALLTGNVQLDFDPLPREAPP